MIDIHRFADQIQAYEQYPPETGKVLLYGSSFFGFWGYERAKKQCAEATNGKLEVVNHGFGGATVTELLYYYHRLVLPCQPSAMVLRTGHNDVWECSPEAAITLTDTLINWIQNDFPQIPLIFLKAFDFPSATAEHLEKLHSYNRLLEQLAAERTNLHTVDLHPFLYAGAGEFRNVFREDGLHLTDSGYEEMAKYLAPILQKILN